MGGAAEPDLFLLTASEEIKLVIAFVGEEGDSTGGEGDGAVNAGGMGLEDGSCVVV